MEAFRAGGKKPLQTIYMNGNLYKHHTGNGKPQRYGPFNYFLVVY